MMRFLLVSVILGTVLLALAHPAYGDCGLDEDWPEKPCLDTPPYSKSYLKEVWQKYYDYKGKEWMETKKVEMDQAIRNGTLNEWVGYHSEPNNFANYNVYFYYFLNDQAPNIDGYFFARNDLEPMITYWYISPGGVAAIAGIVAAVTIIAAYLVRKIKYKQQ